MSQFKGEVSVSLRSLPLSQGLHIRAGVLFDLMESEKLGLAKFVSIGCLSILRYFFILGIDSLNLSYLECLSQSQS